MYMNKGGCAMNGHTIDSFSIVYIMQLPQSNIDATKLTDEMLKQFDELRSAKFASLPKIPQEVEFPLIQAKGELLSVTISQVRYAFNFKAVYNNDKWDNNIIKEKVEKTFDLIKDVFNGPYRLGVVIDGIYNDFSLYNKYISQHLNIHTQFEEGVQESQFSVRKLINLEQDIKLNLWKRCAFLQDKNIGNTQLDLNSSPLIQLRADEMCPVSLYENYFHHIIEENLCYGG